MPEAGFARLVNESDIALQLCTAGNLRTALLTAKLLDEAKQPERLLIATDTPTGSGIMPLGMFYTISHLASLGHMPPEQAIAAATGNNATVYRLNSGFPEDRQGCRRGADRRLRRRLAGRCAVGASQWRCAGSQRRDH
jgi:enamidase